MIVTRPTTEIVNFVAEMQQLPPPEGRGCVAIGWKQGERLTAGAVFYGYSGDEIRMHIGCQGRFTPAFVAAMTDYPFRYLGCERLVGLIELHNQAGCRFAEHLGAECEDVIDGICIYVLTRKRASKWLTEKYSRRIGVTPWVS